MIGKLKNTLRHLFLPRESNNHRAKLLHPKSLFLVVLLLIASSLVLSEIRVVSPQILGISHNVTLDELFLITNQKRLENNLPPLKLNSELSVAAQRKAEDMFAKDYWAHNSPSGTTPWKFIKEAGYNYIYAGENLARGFTSGSETVNAWMDSSTHRLNLLSANYEDVGFAVVTGKLGGEETVLVVQEFGGRREFLAQKPVAASQSSEVSETPTKQVAGRLPQANIEQKTLINSIDFTSDASRAILVFFSGVFAVDMVFVERRKIIRFVGHNLDHILFLLSILGILAIISRGVII
ncbi:MAG: hypothetical protein UU21_C0010G0015 [Candidatus Levybacteria bacterium GW2011_GWA2_40_8]|nr:MAG: hypothetical protein UU21_C0010G0015 [Candidatus Levybacteria bacterium GW2011_GWA2_40_8]